MKSKFILGIIVVAMFVAGCKPDMKPNAVKFWQKMGEYVSSEEFKNVALTSIASKNEKNIDIEINKKSEEIAKSVGFKSGSDMKEHMKKYKDDPSMKAAFDGFIKKFAAVQANIVQEAGKQASTTEGDNKK